MALLNRTLFSPEGGGLGACAALEPAIANNTLLATALNKLGVMAVSVRARSFVTKLYAPAHGAGKPWAGASIAHTESDQMGHDAFRLR